MYTLEFLKYFLMIMYSFYFFKKTALKYKLTSPNQTGHALYNSRETIHIAMYQS